MTINELAKEVHKNAVKHGWWDEERSEAEVIALIHSEWSEALEEARAGRPLVYKDYIEPFGDVYRIAPNDERYCSYNGKPNGIAVELIDGVIRIFDWIGKCNIITTKEDGSDTLIDTMYNDLNVELVPDDLSELIAYLHRCTAEALRGNLIEANFIMSAAAIAMSWVKMQGLDPLALLLEKHEYNKTRPYKHGKKF